MLSTLKGSWNVASSILQAFGNTWHTTRAIGKQPAGTPRAHFDELYCEWARAMIRTLNVGMTVSGAPIMDRPGIFVGNHISYLDIMAVASLAPIHFVAKSEVRGYPLVGRAAETAGTIFVKRDSSDSKKDVAETIRVGVLEQGKRIAVFPEGTTTIDGIPWRQGVFRIAHEHKIPVQAFTICYRPVRRAAYIADDHLISHMIDLIRGGHVVGEVEFHEPIQIEDLNADPLRLESWVKTRLKSHLAVQGWPENSPGHNV
jgi:1-acyl-sn-glycerol-3-phosphate acyltransferase